MPRLLSKQVQPLFVLNVSSGRPPLVEYFITLALVCSRVKAATESFRPTSITRKYDVTVTLVT